MAVGSRGDVKDNVWWLRTRRLHAPSVKTACATERGIPNISSACMKRPTTVLLWRDIVEAIFQDDHSLSAMSCGCIEEHRLREAYFGGGEGWRRKRLEVLLAAGGTLHCARRSQGGGSLGGYDEMLGERLGLDCVGGEIEIWGDGSRDQGD
ncbi:hypothetical protein HYDPIDRAFT_170976 [Hydnomerulius pinastri MD-312]|uniref:Uncharacterized protein n=1 Tax=Hydnomerulius pinastri MD-312 TaxID=994086 RepID=A0A0C9W8P6_9AGAM|nr:hypothetical protein HYDPIDRAFT_170976 [Hydnomerulius pinastri MD-312]